MERHATYVHTFSAPAPARPLPPPALATGEEEKTALYLRARCRIARPMTWEDIVADRAARGLRTLDEPLPALVAPRSSSPTRGPSPSRGPKRERAVWEKFTWGANPFGEWERERRVGKAVKSMADLLSRPEWKGASVVGEAPDPAIARHRERAARERAKAHERTKEAERLSEDARETMARASAADTERLRASLIREAGGIRERANSRLKDAQDHERDARAEDKAAEQIEAAGGRWVVLRHPSGATVTIDPSKVA